MIVDYRFEYMGFILRKYDIANSRWNSVLLSGACLWKLDRLQRVVNYYANEVFPA